MSENTIAEMLYSQVVAKRKQATKLELIDAVLLPIAILLYTVCLILYVIAQGIKSMQAIFRARPGNS